VDSVFCKSTMINEIHDSSLHMCADFISLVFKVFLFSQTKWHTWWDLILLPSSLLSDGHHKFLHKLRVLALHWTMLVVDINFLLRHKAGKGLKIE
jgi:hypothetical protein